MRQATNMSEFEIRRQGLIEISRDVNMWVSEAGSREGLLTLVGD